VAGTRFGIAGCGNMGRRHATALVEAAGATVVGVTDPDPGAAATLAADVGAGVFPDVASLLAGGGLDALVVTTPPRVRREIILPAARAGVHLFVEKPPAFDLSEARECREALARAGVLNAVGFMLRFQPITERARDLLRGRRITLVRTVLTIGYYLHLRMPLWFLRKDASGGPLVEQAIHVLDAARHLAGDDVTHVFARGDRIVRPDVPGVDAEDTLALTYRFASGALGVHSHSCAIEKTRFEVECLGADFRLLVDYTGGKLSGVLGGEICDETFPAFDAYRAEIVAFAQAVRGEGDDIRSTYADAVRTLAVTLAGNRSLDTAAWEPVLVD